MGLRNVVFETDVEEDGLLIDVEYDLEELSTVGDVLITFVDG